MPSKRFKDAISKLSKPESATIRSCFSAWKADPSPSPWPQIAANIENETALKPQVFAALLKDFINALPASPDSASAWKVTCKDYLMRGNALPNGIRPPKLGRACKFDTFIGSNHLSDAVMIAKLTKFAGREPITAFKRVLGRLNIGRSPVFATFDPKSPANDPFESIPKDYDAVRTVLGLGHHPPVSPAPYLLFTYSTSEPPHFPLHRPSAADAADFPHYRPRHSPSVKWGMTKPVAPNSRNLPARPEVVHAEITGARLVFPYQITS
jgi:hypothetical protein